ncbi:MAG: allantoate amidohydrolase [Candidatus Methylacidiphilales bacterium]
MGGSAPGQGLADAADRAWARLQTLGTVSDEAGVLTRVFAGPGLARASGMVAGWMNEAGLLVERDGWGNVFGRTAGPAGRPLVILGSHLDTVRNAGKYDGALGVLVGLAVLEAVGPSAWEAWPFSLEVAAFSDEEGARFQTTYLGSRAALGKIYPSDLTRMDSDGIRLEELISEADQEPVARYRPGEVKAYVETHIEQGPVLESEGLALGVVSAIAGQTRARVEFKGRAAHAGTCPMRLRRDALTAAAEWILAVEASARRTDGLVATVGCLEVDHAAPNVVPGRIRATLDVRHAEDSVRKEAVLSFQRAAEEIARTRGLTVAWEIVQENGAVACGATLRQVLKNAVEAVQGRSMELVSGAGHDAVPMAGVGPVGMLFVRCAGGVSHHPDESVLPEDIRRAIEAMVCAMEGLSG